MAEPLVGQPDGAPESIRHGSWSDSSARSVLQLMVESVVELVDFRVATLSVVLGDNLVTMAYAGPDEFRKAAMTIDPVSVLGPVLDQAETWGRFHFLASEDIVGQLPGTWIETTRGQTLESPDAWQPSDVLLGVLYDEDGSICGVLSVDSPTSGLRPDPKQKHLLERYAAQAERAVLTAFERESLVQRVAHAESARRLVRAASMPAQASLEAVLSNIHQPLVEGFNASGSWIEARGPADSRHGYARGRSGTIVPLPAHAQAVAHRLGSTLWTQQRALVISDGPGPFADDGDLPEPLLEEARALLRSLDLRSMLAVALGAGQECLGFLALTRRAQDPPWSAIETSSALEIGHDLGAALMAARALERERHLVDELQQLDDYRIHLIET
ncbi:GAF domain-containing protein, partial [Nocardioides sp.]|uniref:GAF domain-containing protein n=1 Tax=Nocardioides sp. TaxID=35761 RepID=UPI002B27A9EF